MKGLNMLAVITALLLLFSLSCSAKEHWLSAGDGSYALLRNSELTPYGPSIGDGVQSVVVLREPAWSASKQASNGTKPLFMHSYADLSAALLHKMQADLQDAWKKAENNFAVSSRSLFEKLSGICGKLLLQVSKMPSLLRSGAHVAITGTLRSIQFILISLMRLFLLASGEIISHHFWNIVVTLFLVGVVRLGYLALRWVFSDNSVLSLVRLPFSTCGKLFLPKYKKEMAVRGSVPIKIRQSPPKNSVVEISHSDGSHAGYGSAIMLQNGMPAMITAEHVITSGSTVHGVKTGNSLKIDVFKPVLVSKKLDLAIFYGPSQWTSLLGVKTSQFVNHSRVTKGPVSCYTLVDGQWEADCGKVTGIRELSGVPVATVISNTDDGYSGSPYYCGKTIQGIHIGCDEGLNHNLMALIPAIRGLTAPDYKYESSMNEGSIVSSEDSYVKKYEEYAEELYREYTKFGMDEKEAWSFAYDCSDRNFERIYRGEASTPKIKTTPADLVSQDAAPPSSALPQPKFQGNEKRGSNHVEKLESTLSVRPSDIADMLKLVSDSLIAKVDLRKIESMVVDKLSSAALKKPKSPTRRRRSKKSGNAPNPASVSAPKITNGSSTPNSTGKYVPVKRFPDSMKSERSRPTTIPQNHKTSHGGNLSSRSTQNWVRKSQVSGGQNLATTRN
nr:MAG: polyprotein [Plant associated polerovirus 3]